jgi:hypothetical protein
VNRPRRSLLPDPDLTLPDRILSQVESELSARSHLDHHQCIDPVVLRMDIDSICDPTRLGDYSEGIETDTRTLGIRYHAG